MASSSVSQESLDRDDYEYNARRSRIRPVRTRASMPAVHSKIDSYDVTLQGDRDPINGDHHHTSHTETGDSHITGGLNPVAGEHDSPTRGASRVKDKRVRPSHLHKGKPAKDKRKLREKRRSTGVVHMLSPESTGDSLDDDDDTETKRNTSLNEIVEHRTSPIEENGTKAFLARSVRNKSPSDLEADLEDNQDYDSTVSQSETNLTIIGQLPASTSVSQGHVGVSRIAANRCFSNIGNHREEDEAQYNRPHLHRGRSKDWDSRESGEKPTLEMISPRSVRAREHRDHADSPMSYRSHLGYTAPSFGRQDQMEAKLLAKNKDLEQQLAKERDENSRLIKILEERDNTIADLQREIKLLHGDLEIADDDMDKLQAENQALLRAMAMLSADC